MNKTMKDEINNDGEEGIVSKSEHTDRSVSLSILVSTIILSSVLVYSANSGGTTRTSLEPEGKNSAYTLEEKVLPRGGVVLPVRWGDLGAKLVDSGTIDAEKFVALYNSRGEFNEEYESLLLGRDNDEIRITEDNADYLLNLFWALGLANKNSILDSGEMMDPRYGGAGNFASTGGWTMAMGDAMDHYSKHVFFTLTEEEQSLVDKISQGIYRPCCGNSTHFPDCNHGMAMLGLLQLMASQGVSEEEMWKTALAVNSYWFPDTYMTIAQYMDERGVEWENVRPEEVLGRDYSSAQGFSRIAAEVTQPGSQKGGGGCGV